jgi:beta-lactamase regulating signal transducer with metallopeptidase domain
MAEWSQSHFLQSLGWATLNSFWQMALIWCLYLGVNQLFKLNYQKRYQFSVIAIICGFIWFLVSFGVFYSSTTLTTITFFDQPIRENNKLLQIFLTSASVAYLSLLLFPSYKLFKNWQFVQKIKKEGLRKANLEYRLFVQKIAAQLGIKKKVSVYLSDLVKSPLTVGFLKPIVLLPVAALSNLSLQQTEAILLHELSHIKRFDYLVNFIISIINTLLYFNPFVKQFMKTIEAERENCCDQLVLQFGYDKVGYASALLTLEKLAARSHSLVLGATGKNYLLNRIEKIVGMEKKTKFKLNDFAGLMAAFLCIVVFNSILIIKEEKKGNLIYSYVYTDLTNPFHLFDSEGASSAPANIIPAKNKSTNKSFIANTSQSASKSSPPRSVEPNKSEEELLPESEDQPSNDFVQVGFDEVEGSLNQDQKEKVRSTVTQTKKVLTSLQWKEVENSIADAMNDHEKLKAKEQYVKELDKNINWKNIENNLKAKYELVDWTKINKNLECANKLIKLDSMQQVYKEVLIQLDKANTELNAKAQVLITPLPDQSIEDISKAKHEIQKHIEEIKAIRNNKKVVRL